METIYSNIQTKPECGSLNDTGLPCGVEPAHFCCGNVCCNFLDNNCIDAGSSGDVACVPK